MSLMSGCWEGCSRVGLGLKVPVRASRRVSVFSAIPHEVGHV